MAAIKIGDVAAHYPGKNGGKSHYRTVGNIFRNSETGRLSIKLDLVPVGEGWSGWLNIFDKKSEPAGEEVSPSPTGQPPAGHPGFDDIPF